jgi:hypothetical protein
MEVAGVNWLTNYAEVHVILRNASDANFEDVDLVIRLDQPIAAVGQASRLDSLVMNFHESPTITPEWLHADRRVPIPVKELATTIGVRVRCDLFPRNSYVDIVLAAATIAEKLQSKEERAKTKEEDQLFCVNLSDRTSLWYAHKNHSIDVFGARPKVSYVEIKGQFTARGLKSKVLETVKITDFQGDTIRKLLAK